MDIKPSLHPWDKSCLIMVNDSLNVLLNSVCWHFVEDFWPVCQGYWSWKLLYQTAGSLVCWWWPWAMLAALHKMYLLCTRHSIRFLTFCTQQFNVGQGGSPTPAILGHQLGVPQFNSTLTLPGNSVRTYRTAQSPTVDASHKSNLLAVLWPKGFWSEASLGLINLLTTLIEFD